jgi:His/Glu/Gln/Arg/opine family amino acid ABC transporter permease subunit
MSYFVWGDHGWLDEFARGVLVTVALACVSYAVGLLIGILGAAAALSRVAALRAAALGYTVIGRSVPELLLIVLIFYGGNQAIQAAVSLLGNPIEVELGAFGAGVVALAFVVGAASTSIFRGALLSVDKGQIEAATALGLARLPRFGLVILPQAVRYALPGLGNVWIGLLKETALVSVIGLNDILRVARIASGATHEPMPFLLAAGAAYLGLTALSVLLIRTIGHRLRVEIGELRHAR